MGPIRTRPQEEGGCGVTYRATSLLLSVQLLQYEGRHHTTPHLVFRIIIFVIHMVTRAPDPVGKQFERWNECIYHRLIITEGSLVTIKNIIFETDILSNYKFINK